MTSGPGPRDGVMPIIKQLAGVTPTPTHERRARLGPRRLAAIGAIVFGVAAVVALARWGGQSTEEALRQVPEGERRALCERTLRALESTCDPQKRPAGLEDFCRQEAEFIVRFPNATRDAARLRGTRSEDPRGSGTVVR